MKARKTSQESPSYLHWVNSPKATPGVHPWGPHRRRKLPGHWPHDVWVNLNQPGAKQWKRWKWTTVIGEIGELCQVYNYQNHQQEWFRMAHVILNCLTSSAAQGGGGSFKNRKPIGEVGCCESRMAEQIHCWTDRWLELCFSEWFQWLQWSPYHNCWM